MEIWGKVNEGELAGGAFGENLREARIARGLTQEQLGLLTDIHASNLGRIERGTANPSLATMTRIACALDMQLAELMRGIPARVEGGTRLA